MAAPWINRTQINATPTAGASTNTITFPATAAGSLLVLVIDCSTVVSMPAGWTRNLQAVNNTDLTVWSKTATGGETSAVITTGANYSVVGVLYEFPSGTTTPTGLTATGSPYDGANPTITGLSGSPAVFAVYGIGTIGTITSFTVAWTSTPASTGDVTTYTSHGTVDGAAISVAYVNPYTTASYTPTADMTGAPSGALGFNSERITFSLVPGAAASGTTVTKTQADPVAITDAATDVLAAVRSQADPVGITDGVTASLAQQYVANLSDTVGITDTGSPQSIVAAQDAADPVTITDQTASTIAATRQTTDTVGITDTVTVAQTGIAARTQDDPVAITDTVSVVATTARPTDDTVGLVDSVTVSQASGASNSIGDAAGITDAVTVQMSRVVTLDDFLALTDAAAGEVVGAGSSNPVDRVGVTDGAVATLVRVTAVTVADTIGIADTAVIVNPSTDADIRIVRARLSIPTARGRLS